MLLMDSARLDTPFGGSLSATADASMKGTSQIDAEAARRQAIAAKVLQRAELSKTARHLQQRLALAFYKAQNNCTTSKLAQLEPQVELQYQKAMAKKRKAEQDAIESSAKRQHIGNASSSDSNPYPPRMSLYDAMMTPSMPALTGAFPSPQLSEGIPAFPRPGASPLRVKTPSGHKSAYSNSTLNHLHTDPPMPTSPVSSARDDKPGDKQRPPQHVRTSSLPHLSLHGSGPFSPSSAQMPVRPISTSDPTFVKSAPEFVAAANALTSLTRASSEESGLPSPAPENAQAGPSKLRQALSAGKSHPSLTIMTSPNLSATNKINKGKKPASASESDGSADAAGESDRESAAELMLWLATSPSPVSSQHMDSPKRTEMDPPPMSVQGRRLMFGEPFDEGDLKKLAESVAKTPNALKTAPLLISQSPLRKPQSAPAHIDSFSQSQSFHPNAMDWSGATPRKPDSMKLDAFQPPISLAVANSSAQFPPLPTFAAPAW